MKTETPVAAPAPAPAVKSVLTADAFLPGCCTNHPINRLVNQTRGLTRKISLRQVKAPIILLRQLGSILYFCTKKRKNTTDRYVTFLQINENISLEPLG